MSRFTLMENLPDLVIASTTTVTMASSYLGKPTRISVGGFQNLYTTTTTLNFATTGLNALDTGAIASNTLYYIYAVKSSGGIAGLVASTAAPATGPTGYTAWREVARCRTLSSAATLAAIVNKIGGTSASAAVSEWVSYTPTWSSSATQPVIGNGTITGQYRRVGPNADVRITVRTGTTTTYGSGAYYFSYPPGLTPNNSVLAGTKTLGEALVLITSSFNVYNMPAYYVDSTKFTALKEDGAAAADLSSVVPATWTAALANQGMDFTLSIPIAEWAGLYT